MVLLGLSIFLASLSFLCYQHPPFSWRLWEWLRRPSLQNVGKGQVDAPTTKPDLDSPRVSNEIPLAVDHKDVSARTELIPLTTQNDLDRRSMPPPPPPLKKPTSGTPTSPNTPRATTVPILALEDSPPAPSFPAMNSAQRASGGVRGPPRLPATQFSPGLMAPPPKRSHLPNRSPSNSTTSSSSSSSSSLALPPTHTSIPSKPRQKVLLTPGHSPLDWARLSSSPNVNLRGLPPNSPYLRVPPSLLRQFTGRKGKDAWTVLGGKVYNITPYLPYHPGGEPELMKAAGRDGTKLFGEVHPWVNWEGMLEGCLVGIAVEEGDVRGTSALEEMD